MNTSIRLPFRRQLQLADLLLQIAAFALVFTLITYARQSRNIWLIQTGALLIGVALWTPVLRRPSLRRLHLFTTYYCWWIVVSWFLTYAIWASAFGRDFWIPQIIAIDDVGFLLCRFALLPMSLTGVAFGVLRLLRDPPVWTCCATVVGCLPIAACTTMEAVGLVQW